MFVVDVFGMQDVAQALASSRTQLTNLNNDPMPAMQQVGPMPGSASASGASSIIILRPDQKETKSGPREKRHSVIA